MVVRTKDVSMVTGNCTTSESGEPGLVGFTVLFIITSAWQGLCFILLLIKFVRCIKSVYAVALPLNQDEICESLRGGIS